MIKLPKILECEEFTKGNEFEGYMNENYEDLINRLDPIDIIRHIKGIKFELQQQNLTKKRIEILTERLTYCYKKLRCRD